MTISVRIIVTAIVAITAGCTVDDDERCVDGYVWNDVEKACLLPIDTSAADDTVSETVQGEDTGTSTDSSTGSDSEPEIGLGETCVDDNSCSGYQANYCLLDPSAPSNPGICTILNCTAGGCGGQFTCCDCAKSPFVTLPGPICAPNSNVADLSQALCEC